MEVDADHPFGWYPKIFSSRRQHLKKAGAEIVGIAEIVERYIAHPAGRSRARRFGLARTAGGFVAVASAQRHQSGKHSAQRWRWLADEFGGTTLAPALAARGFGAQQLPEFGDRDGGSRIDPGRRVEDHVGALQVAGKQQ